MNKFKTDEMNEDTPESRPKAKRRPKKIQIRRFTFSNRDCPICYTESDDLYQHMKVTHFQGEVKYWINLFLFIKFLKEINYNSRYTTAPFANTQCEGLKEPSDISCGDILNAGRVPSALWRDLDPVSITTGT